MACGFSQNQQQSNTMPQINPSYTPDPQTQQMIANYGAMRNSGVFNTSYQNAMRQHPIIMGLANAGQAFAQGLTHQPFYTANQENQANLQNTQQSGLNSMIAMPAQMRMQMMMFHPELFAGAQGGQPAGNIPGVDTQANTVPSLAAPQPTAPTPQPAFVKMGTYNGQRVGMTKDGQIVQLGASNG